MKGKVVAINTTPNLAKFQAALSERVGRDVFMYSITLDPTNDTPDVLKRYAQAYGAKPGWTFLTGKAEDIKMLRRKLGVYDRDPLIDAAALSKPVRIRQAIERTLLPPSQWPTGEAVVKEAPYEVREAVEPADLSASRA